MFKISGENNQTMKHRSLPSKSDKLKVHKSLMRLMYCWVCWHKLLLCLLEVNHMLVSCLQPCLNLFLDSLGCLLSVFLSWSVCLHIDFQLNNLIKFLHMRNSSENEFTFFIALQAHPLSFGINSKITRVNPLYLTKFMYW